MMRLAALLLLVAGSARGGVSMRYALVIGNNAGASPLALEPLRRAEREAAELRDKLVRFAHFDVTRVELVAGGSRQQVLDAAARLAARHNSDIAALGPLPSVFALFFTGHGLSGRLLTSDAPLDGGDLAGIVRAVGATLTVGFFDACFSGSLEDSLRGKGARATPGFNPVAELPREVLESEGTMWFVSSRPDELSYEDERLGGLFTHFFSEAFTEARPDGVGVTLENMWEYARAKTVAHAARAGRSQTPEKIIRQLKARAPLYFSFPLQRSATLTFQGPVAGTFLLHYERSALVETIVKTPGAALTIAVYDGPALLWRAQGEPASAQQLDLQTGGDVTIGLRAAPPGSSAPGFSVAEIHSKGSLPGLVATQPRPRWALAAGAGLRGAWAAEGLARTPLKGLVDVWLGYGPWSLALTLGYGRSAERFEAWSYALDELESRAWVAYGFDLGGPRIELAVAGGPAFGWLAYGSGARRSPVGGWVGGGARLLLPIPFQAPVVEVALRPSVGARLAQGLAAHDVALHAALEASLEAVVTFPFF